MAQIRIIAFVLVSISVAFIFQNCDSNPVDFNAVQSSSIVPPSSGLVVAQDDPGAQFTTCEKQNYTGKNGSFHALWISDNKGTQADSGWMELCYNKTQTVILWARKNGLSNCPVDFPNFVGGLVFKVDPLHHVLAYSSDQVTVDAADMQLDLCAKSQDDAVLVHGFNPKIICPDSMSLAGIFGLDGVTNQFGLVDVQLPNGQDFNHGYFAYCSKPSRPK
jgi:hypothetical protein